MATPICGCGAEPAALIIGMVESGEQTLLGMACLPEWLIGMMEAVMPDLAQSSDAAPESPTVATDQAPVVEQAPKRRSGTKGAKAGTTNAPPPPSSPPIITVAELEAMTEDERAALPAETIISDAEQYGFAVDSDPAPAEG